jgi:hypothetical protein
MPACVPAAWVVRAVRVDPRSREFAMRSLATKPVVGAIIVLAALLMGPTGAVSAALGETCTFQEWVEDGVLTGNPAPSAFLDFTRAHPEAFVQLLQGGDGQLIMRITPRAPEELVARAVAMVDPCVTVVIRVVDPPRPPDTATLRTLPGPAATPGLLAALFAVSLVLATRWASRRRSGGS